MAQALGCTAWFGKDINYSVHEVHIYSEARNIHECR